MEDTLQVQSSTQRKGKSILSKQKPRVKARHRNHDTQGHSASELPGLGKTLNTLEEPHNWAHEAARHDGDGRGLSAIEANQPHHTVTHLETKAPSSEANEKVSS